MTVDDGQLLDAPSRIRDMADDRSALDLARRLGSELVGTWALTFVAAGGDVIAAVGGKPPDGPAQVAAPALLIMALIYSFGPISGAHFNPAVTLAFALRGSFPWRRVPGYWLAQFGGAVLAAVLLRILFGLTGHLGATAPHHGLEAGLVLEIILTFLLVTVILATAANYQVVGHNAALAVGATIALDGFFAAPISGASMNPARSFGPAVVSGHPGNLWIYIVGPVAGSICAVGLGWFLRGPGSPYARRAATGQP